MYEYMTFEKLMEDMLTEVPEVLDKREGSIIYNALAPSALKLAEAYVKLDNTLDLAYLDSSVDEYLTRKCTEFGVFRELASNAIRKGMFYNTSNALLDVPIGSRFNIENLTLKVIEKIELGTFKLIAEQQGSDGNLHSGNMIPVENMNDLGLATLLPEVLVYGEDRETDEHLRERTRESIANNYQDGNVAQYLKWANDFKGIGRCKVVSLWNGPNTVKVIITNPLNQVASTQLISTFQNFLDPGSQGLGNGKAPIGSKVTVTTGIKKDININAEVVLNKGFTTPDGFANAITKHLSSITYLKNSISYLKLAAELSILPSISEIKTFTINAVMGDIPLADEEIPVLNSLNVVVSK